MKRDPKRIKKILKKIEYIWTKYPALRLGQMICNAFPEVQDTYYIEDELLEEKLDKFIKEIEDDNR